MKTSVNVGEQKVTQGKAYKKAADYQNSVASFVEEKLKFLQLKNILIRNILIFDKQVKKHVNLA